MARKSTIVATGFAMFAMFFGAGNIVFPLALGQISQNQNIWGTFGLMITAVIVPLAGLIGMLLYDGNYNEFFKKIGKTPGFILSTLILCLIGPFAGIPRCITIAYSTLSTTGLPFISSINLLTFSAITCVVIFLFTIRPTKILGLIGKVLTPILLLSLAVIIVVGFWTMPSAEPSHLTRFETFSKGVVEGYNTMDLLASFFFSSIILVCLRDRFKIEEKKSMISTAIVGAAIAAILLLTVYFCFSSLAAGYSSALESVPDHQLLGTLACQLLGPYAGLVVAVLVYLAVLTTMIALTTIFSGFLQKTVFKKKVSYVVTLILTLAISFAVSTLHFDGIAAFVGPILQICYPALIALAILNILHKTYDFKYIKYGFYGILGLTALIRVLS